MTGERIERARAARWLVEDLPAAAVAWLPTMRWYGGKSQPISSVQVDDVLWLSDARREAALVVLQVARGDEATGPAGDSDLYTSVIAFVTEPGSRPLIGTLPGAPAFHAVEATADPQSTLALLRGLASGIPVPGLRGGAVVHADATDGVQQLVDGGADAPSIVPIGLEQSNTSVRVGASHVFKLLRRLEAGEHPQLEFGRFLTRVGFRASPRLDGSLAYRSASGRVHALGSLEGWISSSGDGWTHVTSALRQRDHAGRHQAIADQMRELGATTAALHLALASDPADPAFAPEPVTEADLAAWRTRLVQQADRTRDLLDRLHRRWSGRQAEVGAELLARLRNAPTPLAAGLPDPGDALRKIRIHGDFHLGQTLRTWDGFAIIDFEGEPSKPLAERRQKQCALRDVAGMLRSLDYAWAAELRAAPPDELRAHPGLTAARSAFLTGYHTRATHDRAPFLPRNEDFPRWIAFFELEKALYEVEYEVNNRPAWVDIPIGGALKLLADWP